MKYIKNKLFNFFNIRENSIEKLIKGKTDKIVLNYGSAFAKLSIEYLIDGTPSIYIDEIWNEDKGNGNAKKLLNQIKYFADEYETPITLRASVINNIKTENGLNQQDLIQWYIKNGFRIAEDENRLDENPDAPFMIYGY